MTVTDSPASVEVVTGSAFPDVLQGRPFGDRRPEEVLMARPADPVVAFYSGGADHRGRTLSGILDWPDDRLESVHDYIQWVFPTEAPSGVNPFAPLVTRETKQAFTDRPDLRDRLRLALDRLLAFYGLRRAAGPDGDAPDVPVASTDTFRG